MQMEQFITRAKMTTSSGTTSNQNMPLLAIVMYPTLTVSRTHPYNVLSITDFLGRPASALCGPQGLVASVAAWQHLGPGLLQPDAQAKARLGGHDLGPWETLLSDSLVILVHTLCHWHWACSCTMFMAVADIRL